MDSWETHSNSRQQASLSSACLVMGLALVALLRDAQPGESSGRAGFLFGVLLLLIGGATLMAHARQSIVVDPVLREIRIEDRRLFGRKLHRIAFAHIQEVQVACLQTRTQRAIRYFLQLQLRNGESCALFAPERVYPGASDPAIVGAWKARLNRYLAVPAA